FDLIVGDPYTELAQYDFFALVVQYPSSTGEIHTLDEITDFAHQKKALVTVAADLLSLVLLKAPADFDVDIVVGNAYASGDRSSTDTMTNVALTSSSGERDYTRVENLTKLTNDLDQRLVALDGTVNVVFEALQRNIHAYHDSLSQALARMHYKGVQGEQLLEGFIQNVANLSPAQVKSELIEEGAAEVNFETIDAQSVESTETSNQLERDLGTVENVEVYHQDEGDNLAVTLDETIDNIEFSQTQQDSEHTSRTSDLENAISQLEEDSVSKVVSEELEQDIKSDVEVVEQVETKEQVIEREVVKEADAFDTPERMEAVLSELIKSTSPTEEIAVDNSLESSNDDEVDELYASLFDSENLTSSNSPTPPQEVLTPAIDVENIPTSTESLSQSSETQTEKEVVSREVVFEYIPPSTESTTESTDEISESLSLLENNQPSATNLESKPENQALDDNLVKNIESTTQNPQQLNPINPTTTKTYKRTTQAANEDTI
ncbi:MAG: hypothetical protein MJK14_02800, partial [Rivularia sp. ALOHA_DT_140]|nr:hypothetical protein [Rivularia sp. ALOHA_DT_140]